jgi:methyltransferase (TIGR00027 family)
VPVFEVDHPATQRYKRTRVASSRPAARAVSFVAVDFERDDLPRALELAGHSAERSTFWLWEGVTVYLPPAAVDATLRALALRSAVGSCLVMSYATPEMVPGGVLLRPVIRGFARAIGEPIRGLITQDDVGARLARAGFEVRSDDGTREWAGRYWPPADGARVVTRERLVVARRV